jgi:hypothetical protein
MNSLKADAKTVAIVVDDNVMQRHRRGQPVLVAHGYIDALDDLDARHAQLAQIAIAKVQRNRPGAQRRDRGVGGHDGF